MDDELMTRTLPHPHASKIHEQHVSDERTAEEARLLLESILAQGRGADEKVRALFTANTLFLSALVLGSAVSRTSLVNLTALDVADLALRACLLIALAIATAFSVMGLIPRLNIAETDRSLYFFGHIGNLSPQRFAQEFMCLSENERSGQLLPQVHANAQILQVKYVWIRRSATLLLVAVWLWLCTVSISFVN